MKWISLKPCNVGTGSRFASINRVNALLPYDGSPLAEIPEYSGSSLYGVVLKIDGGECAHLDGGHWEIVEEVECTLSPDESNYDSILRPVKGAAVRDYCSPIPKAVVSIAGEYIYSSTQDRLKAVEFIKELRSATGLDLKGAKILSEVLRYIAAGEDE